MKSALKVGVTWAGNPRHKNDRNRSISGVELSALAGLDDTMFFGLQKATAGAPDLKMVELLDEFPSNYLAYSRRAHRWARGDWQILPWLFGPTPGPDNTRRANPLPLLERSLERSTLDVSQEQRDFVVSGQGAAPLPETTP